MTEASPGNAARVAGASPWGAAPTPGETRFGGETDFWGHVAELRRRLVLALGGLVVASSVAYLWWLEIWRLLVRPVRALPGPPLEIVNTSPTEIVSMSVTLSIAGGALIASPWILYQAWSFVAPGLLRRERSLVGPFLVALMALFLCGAAFGYFTVLPLTVQWLRSYGGEEFTRLWSMDLYVSMAVKTVLGFGVTFEMPVVAFVLSRIGLVTASQLWSFLRYAVVLIFILAAWLTPPDVLSQCLMAGPMLLLYLASIAVAHLARPRDAESAR